MRKVPVNKLKKGMIVARAIYSADGTVLLNKDVVLKASYIVRLKELGVPSVYIVDKLLGDLEVEDVVSEDTRLASINVVKELFGQKKLNSKSPILACSKKVKDVVSNIIEDLLSRKDLMINLTDIRTLDDYTFGHSVNVCILALVTGLTLGYNRSDLLNLGMGALLHDIGKTVIPLEILNKPGKLTKEEFRLVSHHCQYGYDILSMHEDISRVSAKVALEHHERYNGGGYPKGLKGSEIHEFARITGIVDVYDALTADRVYRPAYPPNEAFELLAGSGNFTHDYKIIKAFLSNIALYPVGTLVKLNTGDVGVVTGTAKGCSHQPKVRLLQNASGEPYENQPVIDLSIRLEYFISNILPYEETLAQIETAQKAHKNKKASV